MPDFSLCGLCLCFGSEILESGMLFALLRKLWMVYKTSASCLKLTVKIKNTQEGKIWPITFNLFFFFHSKQLLLKKQSQIHWRMVFIVQLKWRIYKVNGQLVLSRHLLPPHREHHCVVKSPSQWQISHPALQVKHTLSVKKWCCKRMAVAKSSPWPQGSLQADVASGPSLSPALSAREGLVFN